LILFDDESIPITAAPMAPQCRVRMLVAYDGSGFRGFAAQGGTTIRTVAGVLAEAVGRVLRHPVHFTCAGRTDAGVHAWGQVLHFDSIRAAADIDLAKLQRAVNKMLAPAVVVRTLGIADDGFHARFSATSRRYRYHVLNRPVPDPFLAATSWQVQHPLDLRSMRAAGDPLIGEHDFSSFCRQPLHGGSVVRRVHDARWFDLGDDLLRFEISARSFCQQMVRAIVGTMVDVGLGKRRAGDVAGILRARDRVAAGDLAPPHGLTLWEVGYASTSTA